MFNFRRATVFCLWRRISRHKMTKYAKHFWGVFPPASPWLRLWVWRLDFEVYVSKSVGLELFVLTHELQYSRKGKTNNRSCLLLVLSWRKKNRNKIRSGWKTDSWNILLMVKHYRKLLKKLRILNKALFMLYRKPTSKLLDLDPEPSPEGLQ